MRFAGNFTGCPDKSPRDRSIVLTKTLTSSLDYSHSHSLSLFGGHKHRTSFINMDAVLAARVSRIVPKDLKLSPTSTECVAQNHSLSGIAPRFAYSHIYHPSSFTAIRVLDLFNISHAAPWPSLRRPSTHLQSQIPESSVPT